MAFSDTVKALDLPLDQLVVIGSGLLDQLGLRTSSDIDLVVSPELLTECEASEAYDCGVSERGDRYCKRGRVELWNNWQSDLPFDVLQRDATVIDGVAFVAPQTLIARKQQRGSQKDLQDIALLEEYYGR